MTNVGGLFGNTGQLTNAGTLINDTSLGGALGNSGTLLNNGVLINASSSQLDNAGTLSNTGMFTNNGMLTNSGTLTNLGTINGTGSYTQTAGLTINNSSLTQTSVIINNGTLSGVGTITANVTSGSGGTVSPGNPFGTLTINGAYASSGTTLFEISGKRAGQFDVLRINGNATFTGGTLTFDFQNFTPKQGNSWNFLYANAISGWETLKFSFIGLTEGLTATFKFHNGIETLKIFKTHDSKPLGLVARAEPRILGTEPVPEPSSLVLMGSGLGALALWRRQKRS
jgi:PEP-CTERM motif-containing protein